LGRRLFHQREDKMTGPKSDEGSKGFLFESNVVHRTSGESVRFNQCQRRWHTWNGNAFEGDATVARIAAAAQRAGLEPAYKALRPDLLEGRGQ